MHKPAVFIVEDQTNWMEVLSESLQDQFAVTCATSYVEAIEVFARHVGHFHVAIIDNRLDEKNPSDQQGMEVALRVKEVSPETELIVMTAYPTYSVAERAFRDLRVFKFLLKDPEDGSDFLAGFVELVRQAAEVALARLPKAMITLELSPSLSVDEAEETHGDECETVVLPIAVHNYGPGPAFEIAVRISGGQEAVHLASDDGSTQADRITELKAGTTEIVAVPLQHAQEAVVSLSVNYSDSGGQKEIDGIDVPLLPLTLSRPMVPDGRNPYYPSAPIPPTEWVMLAYERDDELNRLMGRVKTGKGGFIPLRGLRRTGKTSLLQKLCQQVSQPDVGILPVEIDALIWQQLWEEDKEKGDDWDANGFLDRLTRAIELTCRFKQVDLERVLSNDDVETSPARHFQQVVRTVKNTMGHPLLLVFDEADSLADFPEMEYVLYRGLKGVVDSSDLMVVLAHDFVSPFWQKIWEEGHLLFEPGERTKLLSRDATKKLATQPAGLCYTPLAEEYMWRITGGYPALVQLVCHQLVPDLQTNEAMRFKPIRAVDIRNVTRNILLSEDKRQYIDYLRFGLSLEERRSLLSLIKAGGIDPRTAEITLLSYDPSTTQIEICPTLSGAFTDDWGDDYRQEGSVAADDLDKLLQDAIRGLGPETKQILTYYGAADRLGRFRLRVGLLYLFLSQSRGDL